MLGRRGERWEAPAPPPKVLYLQIGLEPSEILMSPVWCSRLRLTIGVHLAACYDEFRGAGSDIFEIGWHKKHREQQNCRIMR
ncbi:hypothetical protein TNCV_3619541 [Trichonephila clavipes]|nr:hypothetical protein TNCV_3619541 [Trichonephila clavipes]